jgi:hypothetical protein
VWNSHAAITRLGLGRVACRFFTRGCADATKCQILARPPTPCHSPPRRALDLPMHQPAARMYAGHDGADPLPSLLLYTESLSSSYCAILRPAAGCWCTATRRRRTGARTALLRRTRQAQSGTPFGGACRRPVVHFVGLHVRYRIGPETSFTNF